MEELWKEKCSTDSDKDEFFPLVFFDPNAEKWYTKDEVNPSHILAFDKSDKTWRSVAVGTELGDEEVSRNYKEITRPY